MHHTDRLDGVLRIGLQPLFNQIGAHTEAPDLCARVTHDLGFQTDTLSQLLPQGSKVPGFVHQHMVARTQGVDQRGLPGAGAGGRINHHRLPGLEDFLDVGQYLQAQRAELGAAVVDGGQAHGPQDAVRNR